MTGTTRQGPAHRHRRSPRPARQQFARPRSPRNINLDLHGDRLLHRARGRDGHPRWCQLLPSARAATVGSTSGLRGHAQRLGHPSPPREPSPAGLARSAVLAARWGHAGVRPCHAGISSCLGSTDQLPCTRARSAQCRPAGGLILVARPARSNRYGPCPSLIDQRREDQQPGGTALINR